METQKSLQEIRSLQQLGRLNPFQRGFSFKSLTSRCAKAQMLTSRPGSTSPPRIYYLQWLADEK